MSHLPHETLWALGRNELPPDAAADAKAHLALCGQCQAAFDDVKGALDVLSVLPEPPPMPEAMARRVGVKLAEELDARAAKGLRSWWATLFTPRLVLATALGVLVAITAAYVVTRPGAEGPTPAPIAKDTPTPAPEVAPPPVPELPKTPPKKLTARVASAKKAKSGDKAAAKAQVLAEGSVVSTEEGGSLWMKLPDGTSAGLTSQSQVTLAKLEEKQLTLDVAGGSLAMVVPHREDRVLTVRAGDVEVKDLGTRFLVSREVNRVLVAVEEGSVEVKTPSSTETVRAGRAVAWRDGKLESMPWAVREEPAPTSTAARLTEEDEETPPIEAAVEDEPVDVGPPPPPDVGDPDQQWNAPPGGFTPPQEPVAPTGPPPPPPHVDTAHPANAGPPAPRTRGGFNLGELERRIREFSREVQKPFQQLDRRLREQQAKDIARLADAGDCPSALALADAWLRDTNRAVDADPVRRGVLLQKMRCLSYLGRTTEAEAVKQELQRP